MLDAELAQPTAVDLARIVTIVHFVFVEDVAE
jgi:hypothetical protein